jgi:pyruvate/2-oxoglutarate dehydrogenase complex dihydrolipoamide acyltransferase (E2) component
MSEQRDGYQVIPYPKLRRGMALMYGAVQRTHKTHGLIEVDVTDVRRALREHAEQTGEHLSFTGFLIACVARAIDEDKSLHACRQGGKHLVLFDQVDVATYIEREIDGRKQPIQYIVRAANAKSLGEITRDIRAAQVTAVKDVWEGFRAEPWLALLPIAVLRFVWVVFWWLRGRYPRIQRTYGGTVGLTSVGMFGKGGGWAIPFSYHTLDVAIGGIAAKPAVVDGRVAIRELLCLTLSCDHDLVDGAPVTRFVARLKDLIESGYGLFCA